VVEKTLAPRRAIAEASSCFASRIRVGSCVTWVILPGEASIKYRDRNTFRRDWPRGPE